MARSRFIFITGTDTGVGKTVVAAGMIRHLVSSGLRVMACKPVCSGGREDAEALRRALPDSPALPLINPWFYRTPVAPLLAARMEGRRLHLHPVLDHLRALAANVDCVVVEGAGGLLSPLGEGFDNRVLIRALRAVPIVVARNGLGAVNQVLLTVEALPPSRRLEARIILSTPPHPDASSRTNARMLAEMLTSDRIEVLPHLPTAPTDWHSAPKAARRAMAATCIDLLLRTRLPA